MHFPRPRSLAAVIMSVGIGGAASLALVTDASAHANIVSGVSQCQSDGTYTVTYTVANDYNLAETVAHVSHVGGGTITGLPASIGASPHMPYKTATVVQTGVSGSATVASLTVKGTWSDHATRTDGAQVTLKGNCTTTVTPPTQPGAPSFVDASCSAATGSYTIPTTTGVDYFVTINGGAKTAAPAGTVSEAVGTVIVVSAEAQKGVTLTGTTSWTHTVTGASNCSSPPTTTQAGAPSFVDASCSAATGSYTIPTTTGVNYFVTINGGAKTAAPAGTVSEAVGTVIVVSAEAQSGFTLTGTTSWTHTVTGASNCSSPPPNNPPGTPPTLVTPANPSLTQGVCTSGTESAAFFTIPSITGVSYSAAGAVLAVGDHTVAFGSSTTVTAAATAGFTMAAGAITSWNLAAAPAVTCTVPPASVLGVTFNQPPAAAPPAKVAPAAVLPFTGMPVLPTALLAFGLVLTGALLIGSSKRHRLARAVEGELRPLG